MRVVRLADCPMQCWRNGGGDTCELASHSDGDNVIWRISVATIAKDGPFSCFDGMDRSLVRLDGGKLTLDIDGRAIEAEGEIVAFRGEASVTATIDTAPVRVLNVMTRRAAATHRVTIGRCQPVDRTAHCFAILLAPCAWRNIQLDTGDLLAEVTQFEMPPDISFAMVEISFAPES